MHESQRVPPLTEARPTFHQPRVQNLCRQTVADPHYPVGEPSPDDDHVPEALGAPGQHLHDRRLAGVVPAFLNLTFGLAADFESQARELFL